MLQTKRMIYLFWSCSNRKTIFKKWNSSGTVSKFRLGGTASAHLAVWGFESFTLQTAFKVNKRRRKNYKKHSIEGSEKKIWQNFSSKCWIWGSNPRVLSRHSFNAGLRLEHEKLRYKYVCCRAFASHPRETSSPKPGTSRWRILTQLWLIMHHVPAPLSNLWEVRWELSLVISSVVARQIPWWIQNN
jgi:hypothetical protein